MEPRAGQEVFPRTENKNERTEAQAPFAPLVEKAMAILSVFLPGRFLSIT